MTGKGTSTSTVGSSCKLSAFQSGDVNLEICRVIDQACSVKMAGNWPSSFLLDRTILVNEGFITWLRENFSCGYSGYKFIVVSLHKTKKCQVTRTKELFYYVTSGSNVIRDVHWCVTVDHQQIGNGNIANQIHGFTIDYGKFMLMTDSARARSYHVISFDQWWQRKI